MVSADRTSAGTWGNVPYPVEYVYDSFGRRVEMHTFRADLGWSSPTWPTGSDVAADVTEWVYDQATGLLTDKLDAAGLGPSYTYGPAGRLATRTWARTQADGTTPLVTSYVYDQATGELLGVDYNDATADVGYSYDRLGRQKTVTDAVGVRTFTYDPNTLQLTSEEIDGGGAFEGIYEVTLARKYESVTTGVSGRSAGLQVGDGTAYDVTYGYDARGRFESVSWAAGGAGDVATYGYVPNSDLLSGMTTSSGQSTVYGYEVQRDLKTQVSNSFGGTLVSQYDYAYDNLGRRTSVKNSGSAFSQAAFSIWGYDNRNQLTGSDRYLGTSLADTSSPVGNETRAYAYDPIGNRQTALGQDGLVGISYTPNSLNQYSAIDEGGVVASPVHDDDGDMISDGAGKTLSYNGENRLVAFDDGAGTTASYVYDYIGRRVMKTVGTETTTFLYDGWNMVREDVDADGAGAGAPVSKHNVWGLDLSQSMQGAGGIGGLVAVVDGAGDVGLFAFDGNGNVSEVVAAGSGTVQAHYEYDAFGNVITPLTGAAAENPWRFSTKYVDGESGYSYYGYRYYDGVMGSWTRRDPAGTEGGLNPYSLTQNAPGNYIEFLGLIPDTEAEVREAMRRAIDGSRVTLADVLKLLRDFYTDGPAFLFFGEAIHQVVFEKYRSVHGLRGVLTDRTVAEVFRDALRSGEHPRGSGGLRPDIVNLNTKELYEVKSVRGQVQAEQEAQAYAVALSKLCINLGGSNAGTWGSAVTANGIEVSWAWASPGVITYDFTGIPEPVVAPKPQESPDDLPDWVRTLDKILILIPAIPKVRIAPVPGRGPVPVHGGPGGLLPGEPEGA